MRLVGGVIVLFASFSLGFLRKMQMQKDIESLRLLCCFLSDVRYAVEHSAGGMLSTIETFAQEERYRILAFLQQGTARAKSGEALGSSLAEAFREDILSKRLSRDECRAFCEVLQQLAVTARDTQLQGIDNALRTLHQSLEARNADPRLKSRYFELMYTLAGAGIVILLL